QRTCLIDFFDQKTLEKDKQVSESRDHVGKGPRLSAQQEVVEQICTEDRQQPGQ
ncbi:Hypothetical predicted protein, partial [Marmota monax]